MKRTRTGNRLVLRAALAVAGVALLFSAAAALAAGSGKDKQSQTTYALVAGTVFRETGMAFGGAEVAVAASGDSREARKFKKMRFVTSPRGEFVFRLPAAPMQYTLRVAAPGYQAQEKTVAISGEDRIDVFFKLEPASR
jgi:hypothetical protein